jgi:hypothetical protein
MSYIHYTFEDVEIEAGMFNLTVCAKILVVDNGIGPYEFWGQSGYHEDLCAIVDDYEIETLTKLDNDEENGKVFSQEEINKQILEWIDNNFLKFENDILESVDY